MAPRSVPSTGDAASTHIPTESDVTTSGGVWAPTSAKREKLRELKVQLSEENEKQQALGHGRWTLDDLATAEQRLDLYLADGLKVLTRFAEETRMADADAELVRPVLDGFTSRAAKLPDYVTQVQWEEFLTDAAKDVELHLSNYPSDRCLKPVRDFFLPDESSAATSATIESNSGGSSSNSGDDATTVLVQSLAQQSIIRLRLLLALGAAEHLKDSWKALTAMTDQDVDRAAVKGESVESQVSTLHLERAVAVLAAHLQGNAADRVDALWSLVDRDQDGLLDEVEMVRVCELAVEPYRRALKRLFQEALRANPVREPLALLDAGSGKAATSPPPPGWRQRRRDAKERKRLTVAFERTLRVHYLDEVEMPHRLRCIYAWANKRHQENKVDSVMVDEAGWTGRKRYVELQPKISLSEFREVQREHFKHLDRVGGEFVNSFREELWIAQGKGRNRRKLIRDCSLFLAVVCTTDLMIGML